MDGVGLDEWMVVVVGWVMGGGCPKPNIAAAVATQPPTRQGPAKVSGGEIL